MGYVDKQTQVDLDLFKQYEEMPEEELYTHKEILLRLAEFKKANPYRNWSTITREMDTNYQSFITFKNLKAPVSQNYLKMVSEFLEGHGY